MPMDQRRDFIHFQEAVNNLETYSRLPRYSKFATDHINPMEVSDDGIGC